MPSAPANNSEVRAVYHSILRQESQVLNSQSAELRARASEAVITSGMLRARCVSLGERITHLLRTVPNRVPDSSTNAEQPQRCRTTGSLLIEERTDARSTETLRRCHAIGHRLQHTWRAIEKSGKCMRTTRSHVDDTVDRLFTCRQTYGTQVAGLLYESLIVR
jgi:hypothetical protein